MANKEHLELLKEGVTSWNNWRKNIQDFEPDLSGADLSNLDLSEANLSNADLKGTNFKGSILKKVNFSHSKTGISSDLVALFLGTTTVLFARFLGFLVISIFWSASFYLLPENSVYQETFLLLFIPIIILILMFWLLNKAQNEWQRNTISLLLTALPPVIYTILLGGFKMELISAVFESLQLVALTISSTFLLAINFSAGYSLKGSFDSISNSFRNSIYFSLLALFIAICTPVVTSQFGILSQQNEVLSQNPEIIDEIMIDQVVNLLMVSNEGKRFEFTFLLGFLLSIYLPELIIKYLENNISVFNWLKGFSVIFSSTLSTNFQDADLTSADFAESTLKSADFRGANLIKVRWLNADIGSVRFESKIMKDPDIKELLLTGKSEKGNLQQKNLKELNLEAVSLKSADLTRTDLSGASLKNANLEGVNLDKVQALSTDFSNAILTGASGFKTWKINDETVVENIECKYVFLDSQEDRQPFNRDFRENEFSELLKDGQKRDRPLRRISIRLEECVSEETNLKRLLELIDQATIEAVFDPYMDKRTLVNIKKMKSFGASISSNLRLLTSEKNNLRKADMRKYFQKSSLGPIECRQVTVGKPHRRYMLLNDSYSLIIGCSLNKVSKDEVAYIDPGEDDLKFFNDKWKNARKI